MRDFLTRNAIPALELLLRASEGSTLGFHDQTSVITTLIIHDQKKDNKYVFRLSFSSFRLIPEIPPPPPPPLKMNLTGRCHSFSFLGRAMFVNCNLPAIC